MFLIPSNKLAWLVFIPKVNFYSKAQMAMNNKYDESWDVFFLKDRISRVDV